MLEQKGWHHQQLILKVILKLFPAAIQLALLSGLFSYTAAFSLWPDEWKVTITSPRIYKHRQKRPPPTHIPRLQGYGMRPHYCICFHHPTAVLFLYLQPAASPQLSHFSFAHRQMSEVSASVCTLSLPVCYYVNNVGNVHQLHYKSLVYATIRHGKTMARGPYVAH